MPAPDPNLAVLVGTTGGIALMMVMAGLQKSMLEFRSRRRTCPSCGRRIERRTCACSPSS